MEIINLIIAYLESSEGVKNLLDEIVLEECPEQFVDVRE